MGDNHKKIRGTVEEDREGKEIEKVRFTGCIPVRKKRGSG